jgi:alkylhydroperoxidase/carboxymuconolactone decarboxylase family protein YurZ
MDTEPMSQRLTRARLDRAEGYRLLDVLQDELTQRATLPGLEQIAPGYADWIVTALFGGTYLREGLSLRDRQLINLATLTAVGGVDPQLSGHARTALRVGLTREQVIEVFVSGALHRRVQGTGRAVGRRGRARRRGAGSLTMRPMIRTVLGDIPAEELGVCDAHDHLFIRSPLLPGQELDDAPAALAELDAFAALGGRAVVQSTPWGLGPRTGELPGLSRRSGVHLVSATGMHQAKHYDPSELERVRGGPRRPDPARSRHSHPVGAVGCRRSGHAVPAERPAPADRAGTRPRPRSRHLHREPGPRIRSRMAPPLTASPSV